VTRLLAAAAREINHPDLCASPRFRAGAASAIIPALTRLISQQISQHNHLKT
jgi:hypothetical protein